MPRIVHPWTWPRAVRDHGPKSADDRNFILALFALHTFVDGDSGMTYVGVRRWAVASRMSVNTLMPLRERVVVDGWAYKSSARGAARESAKTLYRLTVPDFVPLTDKDKELRKILLRQFGDAPQTVSAKSDTDSLAPGRTVSARGDTDRASCGYPTGHGTPAAESVSDQPANCVSGDAKLYQPTAELYQPRTDTEVYLSPSEEVHTKVRAAARAKNGGERKRGGPISDTDLDDVVRVLRGSGLTTAEQIVWKLGVDVITLERASAALKRTGVDA